MLTDLPPRLLHAVRDAAAAVLVLAELGLELLCDQHNHTGALHQLGAVGDES